MVWWHARDQSSSSRTPTTASAVRRSAAASAPVWSQLALHRPAEFNKSHVPAFLADEEPKAHVCVYPFVRSYEWYLLEDDRAAPRCSPSTGRWRATTPTYAPTRCRASRSATTSGSSPSRPTSSHRIVDLMRHLRGSETRRHVREEIPFYTGARTSVADLLARLP